MSFASRAYKYYSTLHLDAKLPKGVEVMNPYKDKTTRGLFKTFLEKYYPDDHKRTLVFGINPGRFGAGITGVAFTDPVALEEFCGIPNRFDKKREPSSVFVYDFIDHWGGPKKFYRDFFISSVCPLGFTKGGVNYNFYDDAKTRDAVTPFIVDSVNAHIRMGGRTDRVILFGKGTLQTYFEKLNAEHGFFGRIDALEHPRFIVQYRRKKMGEYVRKYEKVFAGKGR